FFPGEMSVVEGLLPNGKPSRRVVIPRLTDNHALHEHPLLVDLDTLQVEVIDAVAPSLYAPQTPPATHDGAMYFLAAFPDYPAKEIGLCRFGFPKLSREMLFNDTPQGRVFFIGNRVHVVGKKW